MACSGEGVGEGGNEGAAPFMHVLNATLPAEMENVVDTILFLLSDHSSMTTGSTVPVDGGFRLSAPPSPHTPVPC